MRKNVIKCKGFTLIEVLMVIVIIGILAAVMTFSSAEMVTTAKAQRIANNLIALKMATIAWARDNMDKIQTTGMVIVKERDNSPHPVQEFTDNHLHISKYLDASSSVKFNDSKRTTTQGQAQSNTDLTKGSYGICDGGTTEGYKRHFWYGGYAFEDDEDKVKEKLRKKLNSMGSYAYFGTPDAHRTKNADQEKAV